MLNVVNEMPILNFLYVFAYRYLSILVDDLYSIKLTERFYIFYSTKGVFVGHKPVSVSVSMV
jgi:hypothetical protein